MLDAGLISWQSLLKKEYRHFSALICANLRPILEIAAQANNEQLFYLGSSI
jgi:hypothetical protein